MGGMCVQVRGRHKVERFMSNDGGESEVDRCARLNEEDKDKRR